MAKNEKSSDDSDEEPGSYLGVPAMTGFKKSKPKTLPKKQEKSTDESDEELESYPEARSMSALKKRTQPIEKSPTAEKRKAKIDESSSVIRKRLYIGGLPESAFEADIKKKFGSYGAVKSVEIKCKENYGNKRYFAYIDLDTDETRVEKCIRECDSESWLGGHLKVQLAKESSLQRAHHEIVERKTETSFQKDLKEETRKDETMVNTYGAPSSQCQGETSHRRSLTNEPHSSYNNRRSEMQYDEEECTGYSGGRNRYEPRQFPQRHSREENFRGQKRKDGASTFESERNGLFDEIDAADELGFEQDELLSEEEREEQQQAENDPISEQNLKELFGNEGHGGFVLSSLFADQLKVEEPIFAENEDDRRPVKDTRNHIEQFEEEYWRRAEKVNQRSWQDMVRRNDRSAHKSKMPSAFFILPGDKRLEEGAEVFRTDEDPAQFVDCWREQAEQLTQKLLQRKRNTRLLFHATQRVAGKSNPDLKKKKSFRKTARMEKD